MKERENLKINVYKDVREDLMYLASRAELKNGELLDKEKNPSVEMRISIMKTKNDYKNRIGFEFIAHGRKNGDDALLDLMTQDLIKVAHEEWDVFNSPVTMSWIEGFHLITTEGLVYHKLWNESKDIKD